MFSLCKDYYLYLLGEKNLIDKTWETKTEKSPDHKYHNVFCIKLYTCNCSAKCKEITIYYTIYSLQYLELKLTLQCKFN